MDTKLNTSQKYALGTKEANNVPAAIRSAASRSQKVILCLYSALLKPHLESFVQCWAFQYTRDMELPEWVEHSAAKMIKRLKHPSYEGRPKELGLLSLKKKRLMGILSVYTNS